VRRFLAPPVEGRLRLGVADHFVPRQLAPVLARVARAWPALRLEVEVGRSQALRARLAEGGFDLVLGKRREGETEGRVIFTEAVVWAAAPGFAAPHGRPLPLAMLPQGCLFRDRALAALARAGVAAEIVYTSPSLPGVGAAAAAGLGVTVTGRAGMPEGLAELEGLPPLGTAEMCLFGDAAGRLAVVEPLLAWLREGAAG
jgi:DNA-binding transcriptional LysR family regulator